MTPIELMKWADRIERTQPVLAALVRAEVWRSDPELVERWHARDAAARMEAWKPADRRHTGDVKP